MRNRPRTLLPTPSNLPMIARRVCSALPAARLACNDSARLSTLRKTRPKVAVIGAGWAGFRFLQDVDKDKYDVYAISPRNHFLFTPLLPSTTVGTLEFRCIQEPVRTIKGIHYYQASCENFDFENRKVCCVDVYDSAHRYEVPYDYVILAPGATTATFGVPGISEENHVYFLKQLRDSRNIRTRLIECFERASSPDLTDEAREKLLHFVVVGGGPTSVEYAAELYDFLVEDVKRWYGDLFDLVRVTLVEASPYLLNTFDRQLSEYTARLFRNRHIEVLTGKSVKEVAPNLAILNDGTHIPFGLMVWSTGIKQLPLVQELKFPKHKNGRLMTDDWLRLFGSDRIFAVGDCAAHHAHPLPALAQVAQQQGSYLGKLFNSDDVTKLPPAQPAPPSEGATNKDTKSKSPQQTPKPFEYTHLGSMAQVGQWKGVFDSTHIGKQQHEVRGPKVSGMLAFFLWRAAYWTKSVSLSNKILIPMFWLKSWLFGRDISKF